MVGSSKAGDSGSKVARSCCGVFWKVEASECLLLSDIVRHWLGLPRPKGVKVMEGGRSSVALLWDPIGLQRPSNALELTGRVELSVQVSSV